MWLAGQERVEEFRGRAAGEGNGETPGAGDGLLRDAGPSLRGLFRERSLIGHNEEAIGTAFLAPTFRHTTSSPPVTHMAFTG